MTDLDNETQELKDFFDRLLTQMEILQRFFLSSQERIIKLEQQMKEVTYALVNLEDKTGFTTLETAGDLEKEWRNIDE